MSTVRNLLLLVLVVLLAAFVALNWSAFREAQELSVGFSRLEAPLGLVMLGVVALVAIVFLVYALGMRTSGLVEARKYSRELEAARRLADESEASRLSEMRQYLEVELTAIAEVVAAEAAATREHLTQTENTLHAYLGEIDDYLKRGAAEDGREPGETGTA